MKVSSFVSGYGTVEVSGLSFYFVSLHMKVSAPSLDHACRMVDDEVAREREDQMVCSMW